jgi:hypothetical protein
MGRLARTTTCQGKAGGSYEEVTKNAIGPLTQYVVGRIARL